MPQRFDRDTQRRTAMTHSLLARLALGSLLVLGTACSMDKLTGKDDLPSTLVDPAKIKTPQGAHGLYIASLVLLRDAVGGGGTSYVLLTGLLADEMVESGAATTTRTKSVATRRLPESDPSQPSYEFYGLYSALQRVRGQANQAQQLLRDYYPKDTQGPLMAHMMAAKGYAELLLAEAFCSGIPLSTLDYDGDYTLKPGSKTDDVLAHAIAAFDSAIALSGDSIDIKQLAQIGKGRALLQLGQFSTASQAVIDVADNFRYNLHFSVAQKACGFWDCSMTPAGPLFLATPLSDKEGRNGLPFFSEPDGRLPSISTVNGVPRIPDIPQAYSVTLASGIEAQLIHAEAELAAGNANWLVRVNALRTTCTDVGTCPSPAPAGIGGVSGLALLPDPGTPATRLDLLFRERAYWLFLTGHRQGDLRRLIRRYDRKEFDVYPTGPYNQSFPYGSDVTLPVPRDERRLNPLYSGCYNRGA